MKKRTLVSFFLGALLALTIIPAQAGYWTGAALDNDFWNAANWSGTPPAAFGTTTESLFMTNAVGVTGGTVNSDLALADGVSIAVVNSTLDLTSSTNALVAKALSGNSNNPVQLNVIQFINSTVTLQAVQAMSVSLLNSSALILKGTGRSINSTLEPTSVTLGVGSSITFSAGTTDPDGTGTPAPPRRSNGLSIFNSSSLQSYAADALTAPLTDFSVTGLDLTPFGPLGGGDGVNGGAFTITALQTTILVVNSTEIWDGVANPRAADGVTLTGTGDFGDPAIYTIPNGMKITSTGKVQLWSSATQSKFITFVIQGGDLQMDAGAVLNMERYKVRTGRSEFILDLSGTNSITGAGQIGPITDRDSCPRALTIQNVKNVSLANIDAHTENVNTGASDARDMLITATGKVFVSGKIDNSDQDNMGDGAWGVSVRANIIDVNNIDTRGMRNDPEPEGRGPYNGPVVLQALSPVGGYDFNDSVNNAYTNKLTVRGSILAVGPDVARATQGAVSLQSVVLQLVYGVITNRPLAAKTMQVGVVRGGASATDLFVDVSSSGQTVVNDVQWDGNWTAPSGSAPVFTTDPVIKADATQAVVYAQSLIGNATDADLDPLTFAKFSGPAWLTIAPDGTLSGTPALADACTNTWQISVTDGTRFDTNILQIFVVAGPRWTGNNLTYTNAEQNVAYAGTLATNIDGYCGSATLTYAKVSGPTWLSVAANGTLSGTPASTDVQNNAFEVSVTDGIFPAVNANVNIFVNGSPKFPVAIISKATAFVDQGDYAIRNQTLAGNAIDPQDPNNPAPATLTWAKVSGPAWLTVAADGSLSGTPTAGNIGLNEWTISAANAYPASTATLRIVVAASSASAAIEVVTREFWDGRLNPHASDGVTLTGTGTAADPATYTVPRGMLIYASGQIYTSTNTTATLARTEEEGRGEYLGTPPLHIKFQIAGDLTLDSTNNAFVIALHARNGGTGVPRTFIMDLNGTNSILGQGRIVGLGNRVDGLTFPYTVDQDSPRITTITNVNNVSLYDINVQVRDVSFNGRPLLIRANGKVQITSGIDNSNRDTGGDDGQDINVFASQIDVTTVDTRAFRDASRKSGNIRLNALNPPYETGGNNAFTNTLTIRGGMRANAGANNPIQGTVALEGVVMTLQESAAILTTNTVTMNAGIIQGGRTAGDLFVYLSTNALPAQATTNYNVNWLVPSQPSLQISGPIAGQITLSWAATGYDLQTNSSLTTPSGWGTVPGATSPAVFSVLPGELFYRLKSQ